MNKGGCMHGRKDEHGGCKVGRKGTDEPTHVMPNGDIHTGATHTASSRLVYSPSQVTKVARLLGMLTDHDLHIMTVHNTKPFPAGFQAVEISFSEKLGQNSEASRGLGEAFPQEDVEQDDEYEATM